MVNEGFTDMGEAGVPAAFGDGERAPWRVYGTVASIGGGLVCVRGLGALARMGDQVRIAVPGGAVQGEIVALDGEDVRVLAEARVGGIAAGARAELLRRSGLAPTRDWLGRIVDPDLKDERGAVLSMGPDLRALDAPPPDAATRRRIGPRLPTGYAVLDTLLPLCRGQRIGVFAGPGVGKSSLMAGLARGVEADVVVAALIGERGKEVREFAEDALDPETRARSIIVSATSDRSALARRRSASIALTVAEAFRDRGAHVLLLFDSLTRFAEAHREIALAAGEPPSLRAHPPSMAAELARLTERAGPGPAGSTGDITAVFTVLAQGGDMDEPVADTARGLLDGHVVLSREIAERGRFPAIDVRRSVSRSLPGCASGEENALILDARRAIAAHEDVAPLVRLGAYRAGNDPASDRAVRLAPALDVFVGQGSAGIADSFGALKEILAPSGAGEQERGR